MLNVDRKPGVRLVTDPIAPALPRPIGYRAATDLVGQVISIPFKGYGDLLCLVTSTIQHDGSDEIEVVASDGELSFTHVIKATASVPAYPLDAKGLVQR